MSKSGKYNITAYSGSNFGLLSINLKDDSGDPLDLTGCSVFAQVKDDVCGSLLFDLDPQIRSVLDGEVTFEADSVATSTWPVGYWYWDLIIETADSVVTEPILSGRVNVKQGISSNG